MRVLSDRRVAWVVLVVVALTSLVGFGGRALRQERSVVEAVFNDGTDTSVGAHLLSMDAYLDHCADYAAILLREYRTHASEDTDAVLQVEQLAAVIGAGSDYDARYTAYLAFQENVEALYVDFKALNLTEAESKAFMDAYDNIRLDETDKLRRDGYHDIARAFNATLKSFPASVIAKLSGVRTMNTFDGDAVR